MQFDIPASIRAEYAALDERLDRATDEPGPPPQRTRGDDPEWRWTVALSAT